MFGAGRSLDFRWESFKPQSQLLDIRFFQPMLLRSPIDIDLSFNLFKEDSTFINRLFRVNMQYSYGKHHTVGLSTNLKSSRLHSSNLSEQDMAQTELADFNLSQFGGSYGYLNLDNYYWPRRGLKVEINAGTGMKKIRDSNAVNDTLYTDLDVQSNQFSWEAVLEGYLPLSKYWVLSASWKGAGVYNERLFYNDLYRLGGLNSIRGFSENTFFADNFAYSTLEPRFFFETNSYLFVFYDQAWWLNYELENNNFKDTPWGVGAGISLTTKAGIFNFVWATGNSKSQEIGFNQSKIHFGYISRF
jgi:hemolysin activation/secretion protein